MFSFFGGDPLGPINLVRGFVRVKSANSVPMRESQAQEFDRRRENVSLGR
jgi:hypothetical protein